MNYIKPHPLRAGLFATLCADRGSEYENVLFHTEARWLSRGYQQKMCLLTYIPDIFGKFSICALILATLFSSQYNKHVKKIILEKKMSLGSSEIFDVKMGSQPKKGWEPLLY